MCLRACPCPCVCVCACVCASDCVRACACVAVCGVLRCNSDQDGRTGTFLGCVWLDMAGKVHSLQGAVLCRLAARARRQTISAFEPLILLRAPLTNFGWNPRTKCNLRKICRGIDSHQNWKIGKGIPSPRFGAGIGTSRCKNGPEDWSKGRRCWGWVVRQERTTGRKRHPVC